MMVESELTRSISEKRPRSAREKGSQKIAWRRSSSEALITAVANRDFNAIARTLRTRTLFRDADQSDRREWPCPLVLQPLWSRHAFEPGDRSRALCDGLPACDPRTKATRKQRRRANEAVADLLASYRDGPTPDPFELLGWLMLLTGVRGLEDELFGQIWLQAWEWSRPYWSATGRQNREPLTDDQRVLHTGELPWLCGLVFQDVKGSRRLRERGGETLRTELQAGCDTDGSPQAYLLERLPLWLAPFTRSSCIAEMVGDDWRDKIARKRYAKLVRRVAAITRSTGQIALSNGAAFAQASLLKTAAACAGLKRQEWPVRFLAVLPADSVSDGTTRHRHAVHASRPPQKRKHRPSGQSDAARLACLRSNWDAGADACVIAFDGETPRIDLTAFGVPLLHGTWGLDVTLAGRPLQRRGHWECVCWFSDGDTDYLELKQTAAGDVELLRQVLLARDDHFLLLSDVVKSAGAAESIEVCSRLPLVPGTQAERDALTREQRLSAGPLRVRVLPLGLPQESVHRADGSLDIDSAAMVVSQQTAGTGLACPLVLDWSPARRKAPAQWRQLTVAEGGVTLSGSHSCGTRWRIGDAQWLYYHALTPRSTARTVLGMHTFHETVIGELVDGEMQQLVQVEEGTPE